VKVEPQEREFAPGIFNNSKIKKELGIKFISFDKSINETIPDLIQWGHLEKRKISNHHKKNL